MVQEAFIVVLKRWDRVRAMKEPVGYLYWLTQVTSGPLTDHNTDWGSHA